MSSTNSSPKSSSNVVTENRNLLETNISQTKWFQLMTPHQHDGHNMKRELWCPINEPELLFFMDQLDILCLFGTYDDLQLSPKRLDSLYLLLKIENLQVVKICEYCIKEYFRVHFDKLVYEKVANRVGRLLTYPVEAFLSEFHLDISDFIISLIIKPLPNDNLIDTVTNRLIRFCTKLLKSKYYDNICKRLNLNFSEKLFKDNIHIFREITENILHYINDNDHVIQTIKRLVSHFFDKRFPDNELIISIQSYFDVSYLLKCPSDAIDNAIAQLCKNNGSESNEIEVLLHISQYPNFVYTEDQKDDFFQYAFWNSNSGVSIEHLDDESGSFWEEFYHLDNRHSVVQRKTELTSKIKEIGLCLYPENGFSDLLSAFVMHRFVESMAKLAEPIIYIMEILRGDSGMFDKYGDISLEESYHFVSISNDIHTSYDNFISELKKTHNLPNIYPIEFVLRLVSRILNVVIRFYEVDNEIRCTHIDNTIYRTNYPPVLLCQMGFMEYYLLHPENETFVPIMEQSWSTSIPKTRKVPIVEV